MIMTKRKISTPKGERKVDVAKALEYRLRGMSYSEIGKMMNVTDGAVHAALKRFTAILDDPELLTAGRAHVGDLIEAGMLKALRSSVDDKKLKKASSRDAAIVFGTLFDKMRLLKGQSTENTKVLGSMIIEMHRKRGEIRDRIEGSSDGRSDVLPLETKSYEIVTATPTAEPAAQALETVEPRPTEQKKENE